MGSVVTFYSYKGGVGRSMALANIAVLLAQEKLRVLAVDWDLEAPGLERYFHYFPINPNGPGLLPMLVHALNGEAQPYQDYTWTIDVGSGTPLSFLSSGREREPAGYASRLEGFDWTRFFGSGGGDYLEGLRRQWKRDFDLILIDSRTGLSDTGGVCTIQLPDIVVVMFTANNQSLLGARDVMRHVRKARQALAYPRMELTVFPLPARFGSRGDFRESQKWLDRFSEEFAEFYEDWLPSWSQSREVMERVKIPQVDYFGFGEKLSVVEQGVTDPEGTGYVYDQIARVLKDDFRAAHEVLGLRERMKEEQPARRPEKVARDYTWDVYVSYTRSALLEDWIAQFLNILESELEMRLGRASIFFERQEVMLGASWPDQLAEALRSSRLLLAFLTPAYFQSRWNVAEWRTFEERERLTELELTEPSLILPVALRGMELYPTEMRNRQILDVSQWAIPTSAFWDTAGSVELLPRIRELADWIASNRERVPPFGDHFPIIDPSDVTVEDRKSEVPRL